MQKEEFNHHLILKQYEICAGLLEGDINLLDEIMNDFFTKDYRYNQQLSNVFEVFREGNQHILRPYLPEWIEHLKEPKTNAFWRNSYRYFQYADIPIAHQGLLYDLAFNDMMKAESPIAVKAFAMTTCVNIAKHYPELFPELKQAIELVAKFGSKGVKGRARKMIAKINSYE